MAKNKKYTVRFRRKRKQKTDYRLRRILLSSNKPRLVVRKSLKNLSAQIILYEPKGDKVLVAATTKELKKLGWDYSNNLPTSYLLGALIAKKSQNHNIKEAILDIGLNPSTKGSKLYALLKGALDAGLKIPCSDSIFPSEERIEGKHIAEYAEKSKHHNSRQFTKTSPLMINKKFHEIKLRILKNG